MNINTIWNSIIIIKIRRDDSYNFTLKEIEAFAQVYNIDLEDFCANVLKLSKQQIYNLRNGNNDFVKCVEYKRIKQDFFKEKSSSYRLQLIKEKIKLDFSNSFDIEELKSLSLKLGICARFYEDLLQEGYLYIASKGNPIDENGILFITSSTYEENHGSILYKKRIFMLLAI